jgi:hypothetical protein
VRPPGSAPFFVSGAAPGTSVLAGIKGRKTVSTRRCSVSLSGSPSLAKVLQREHLREHGRSG